MSTGSDAIAGTKLAITLIERLIAVFGWDREKVLRVAKDELHKMEPAPPAQDEEYFTAKQELERQRLKSDTDPAPPPRPSER